MTLPLADKWQIPHTLGFSVFPLVPTRKNPLGKWKQYQAQRATLPVIEQWARRTNLNVGIALGNISGAIGLDLDSDDAIARAYARGLPDTLTARSPRGLHLYYRHPGGRIANAAAIEPGIDLRGDGGFLVAPGSYFIPNDDERADGKREGTYEWVDPAVPMAEAPLWIYEGHKRAIEERPVVLATAYRGEDHTPLMVVELAALSAAAHGERNDKINRCAFALGQLVGGGYLPETDTYDALEEKVHEIGDNPTKDIETMNRGWSDGMKNPRVILTADDVFGPHPGLPEGAVAVRPTEIAVPSVGPSTRPSLLSISELPQYFAGVVYVNGRDEFFTGDGQFLKRQPFDATYSGPKFFIGAAGTEPTKSPSEAFLRNESWVAPRAHRTCFRPELSPGSLFTEEGLVLLNCYVPVPVRRVSGDPRPFLDHVRKMLPNGNDADYLLHYMASCIQNIGTKMQWWPVIQGTKGNGKTMILDVMTYAIGRRYCHLVNPEAMLNTGNQFNGWIENRLFLGFEEIWTAGRRSMTELLKSTVTNLKIVSESKGRDQTTVDNRANGILLTNHPDGVPIDDDERRYGIFWCAQQCVEDLTRDGMSGNYFPALWDWLNADGFAIMADYLSLMPLRPDMDPAAGLHRAPVTTSTDAAIAASLGMIEQEILEQVEQGRHGFAGGIISSIAVSKLADRIRRPMPSRKMRETMRMIGYDWHPALADGRVNNAVMGEYAGKPKLYFRKGHPALALTAAGDILAAYEAAQAPDLPPPPSIGSATP